MALEIEVRFLIFQPPKLPGAPHAIAQGYLSDDPEKTVRIRQVDGDTAYLTIKGAKIGNAAPEFEYEIPHEDSASLMKLCGDKSLTKDRYKIPGPDGNEWELDIFTGRHAGLMIAELELPGERAHFEKPGWLGPEITTDPRFSNASLANTPMEEIRQWIAEYKPAAPSSAPTKSQGFTK
jgi:CYTH domain-containing protein